MRIERLKVNHLVNPLGYDLAFPTISYVVTEAKGTHQVLAQVQAALTKDFSEVMYDSGKRTDIVSTAFELPIELEPLTRYFWRVWVQDETGDSAWSEVQWFETAKTASGNSLEWQAKWITPQADKSVQVIMKKEIQIEKPVENVRAYMTGLGVYEFYLNGEKQGNECLLPGYCNYDSWIQYQTYELELKEGKNKIEMMLGDGWYKGRYGMRVLYDNFGDRLAALAEIHIWYKDGTKEIIGTDETWTARKSQIVETGIYNGEVFDATMDDDTEFGVEEIKLGFERLSPRYSPAIIIHERIKPIEVIHTPAGETVLDMGQNMVGWLQFKCSAPRGTKLFLQFGEILQEGNFYNDNLRTATAEYTYISDGEERLVRQYFTFYGFRYVKISGWVGEINPDDFCGLVIHSEMEEIGEVETADPLVNQLIHNAKWGMKGNFLDVPTDCPQRDERYGWTGDAQMFSGTASFFMDTYAFYTKYGRDVYSEQVRLGGSVPDVVPVANFPGDASTAWGDAATIIPWNVYMHSGDLGILRRQYQSMKDWVDFIKREDDKSGAGRLWTTGAHHADWLALDGNYAGGVYGATDIHMVASAYYYYSTSIVAKAAKVLELEEDAAFYENLAKEIYDAFEKEFFTRGGRLAIDTMTAYVVVLFMGLTPDYAYEKVCKGLLNKLKKNFYHLETGFVGTPYLARVLSENGMNELSYHLLLEKGYPGWLYEVLMGATTVWERWNSVEPDGKISGTEMNSLNHYCYGSIVEWMFRNMVGINPCEEAAGFKKIRIAPTPDYQIQHAGGKLRSAAGMIESSWKIDGKQLKFRFVVPFDAEAEIVLPDACVDAVREAAIHAKEIRQEGKNVVVTAGAGCYEFCYEPTVPYRKVYTLNSTWEELKANPKTFEILKKHYAPANIVAGGVEFDPNNIPFEKELCTLEEMTWGPFTSITQEERDKLDALLREVE